MYFVKTPLWLKKVFKNYTWHVDTEAKELFLTFDDGPHPKATSFVLQQLQQFDAKASFFCLGKNVIHFPDIFKEIIEKGHTIGNHTHNHFNGWNVDSVAYLANIAEAAKYIQTDLFRPPYGRMNRKAGKVLLQQNYRIIMWDVLSGDFDPSISPQQCASNVIAKATKGSIIVFHDSEKAFKNLSYALPKTLEFFKKEGYIFKGLADNYWYKKEPG